jgi:hypothetical protein
MPYEYICESCGTSFTHRRRSSPKNPHRFCSRACTYPPRPGIPGPDGTVLVPLQEGSFAIIDAEDADVVLARRWRREKNHVTSGAREFGTFIYLHHLIHPVPPGFETDHIDGNGLNNRRANLRTVTPDRGFVAFTGTSAEGNGPLSVGISTLGCFSPPKMLPVPTMRRRERGTGSLRGRTLKRLISCPRLRALSLG